MPKAPEKVAKVETPKPLKIFCKNGWGHGVPVSRNLILTVQHVGESAVCVEVEGKKVPLFKVGEYHTPGEIEKIFIFQVPNPILVYYNIGRGREYSVDTPSGKVDWREFMPKAGWSGCPVLNRFGEVVGLISAVSQRASMGMLIVQRPVIVTVKED